MFDIATEKTAPGRAKTSAEEERFPCLAACLRTSRSQAVTRTDDQYAALRGPFSLARQPTNADPNSKKSLRDSAGPVSGSVSRSVGCCLGSLGVRRPQPAAGRRKESDMNESMRLPKEWLEVESILKDAVSGFSDVRGYLRDGDALSADRRLSRIAEDLRAVNGIFAAFSIRAVSVTTPTVED